MASLLQFSDRLTVLPVVHGSGDCAVAIRNYMLAHPVDCLAVPLPATFAERVWEAVDLLPLVSAVVQEEPASASYVPIDPCQPVIAALRIAKEEGIQTEWIDLETSNYEPTYALSPDPYALRKLSLEQFAAAILPSLAPPAPDSPQDRRVRRTAFELHRIELDYERALAIVHFADWPWIRGAYLDRAPFPEHERYFQPLHTYAVHAETLAFFLGELPFITALYERCRANLDPDENLSIDGVKRLVLCARDRWESKRRGESCWITPKLLSLYLQYVRNLTLLERRLSPDLYTLVVAAKQTAGDSFALSVLDTARDYAVEHPPAALETMKMGIGRAELPSAGVVEMKCRLPGTPRQWRTCELTPEPPPKQKQKWLVEWDPLRQCSWPPEDDRVESFHTHVRRQAKAILGADLARTEKFTTSVKDGVDVRETLRNWHTGDIYVREIPPARGGLEIVVFLFDVPADPDKYPWRTTWHAEHAEESTIALFATDFRQDLVGPGIGRARYGGVFFIYPPRYIPDVWTMPGVSRDLPLEDQLLEAAALYSQAPHIAVVSPVPLLARWRRIAKRRGKRFVHLPLSRFSGRTIDEIRTVHVLNGKEIRSYAAHFIRGG
jgi:hypothetical protein